jgi:transcriptional regulator with XRE-family HTH domain
MKTKLSQKQIGQRIKNLRKAKAMLQEDVAKSIGISRPSYTQIEQGNRGIDVMELQRLSQILGFSLDEFLSPDYNLSKDKLPETKDIIKNNNIRVSIPELQVEKTKNVLLYLLEQCAGKPNVGETVLNKLLYFCDFNYYEIYEEHLTGAKYRKLPYGPVPQQLDIIINQMISEGQLQRIKTEYHSFPQIRYLPLVKADLTRLSAAEKTVIDNVIQQMSNWNANKISEYSHSDKPWKATSEGDYISYNLVFYRRPPFSVRDYSDDEED